MATPAHLAKLSVATTNAVPAAGDELDGAQSYSWDKSRNLLETTDFKDSDFKTFIAGLRDAKGSIECDYEPADAPQSRLRTAMDSGTQVFLTLLFDGVNGFTVAVLVNQEANKGEKDGKAQVSFSLQQTGAPIVRP